MSSVSSKTLTTAALLNNKAAQHMKLGRYTQAIVSLAQAVSSLKQTTSSNDEEVVARGEESDQQQERTTGNSGRLSFDFIPPAKEKNDSGNSTTSWYIYKYAIHVVFVEPHQRQAPPPPPPAESCSSPSFMNMSPSRQRRVINILSYAAYFNLALCHHLIGHDVRFDPKSSCRLLKRAARFYNHGQKLVLRHGAEYLLLDENRGVHAFAILCNMGHVYHCLKREHMTSLCSQRLWEAVIYISSSSTNSTAGGNNHNGSFSHGGQQTKRLKVDKSDSCIAGFVTNAFLVLYSSSLPASAA